MSNKSLLIIGCGDLGSRLGITMANQGYCVYGVRRNTDQIPKPIKAIEADLYNESIPHEWPSQHFDYVVFCVAPSKNERNNYHSLYYQGLKNTLSYVKQSQQKIKQLLIVSSTAVYGQNQGEWVDESSITEPSSDQGKIMLAMEQLALNSSYPTACIRLSGIYGPERSYLINLAKQGIHYPESPPLYANRIHIEDATNLIKQLIDYHQRGNSLNPYYIGVDDHPAPIQETLFWLRQQLNISQQGEALTQRRSGSKRLSNQLIKTTGWLPKYPSYKEGYGELLNAIKKGNN